MARRFSWLNGAVSVWLGAATLSLLGDSVSGGRGDGEDRAMWKTGPGNEREECR